MSDPSDLSILVVTSSLDERDSTAELAGIITELRRRPGVTVSVWFLRHGEEPPWVGAKVVDDLRTQPLPAALDLVRIRPVAGVLRGRELRRWWAETAADVVVLDDGLGERILPDDRAELVVVHRLNDVPSLQAHLEADARSAPDLILLPAGTEPPSGSAAATVIPVSPHHDHEASRPFADPAARAIVRKRLGLPEDGLLVVGWGDHAWFDGPDMFVRTIWNLRERHEVDAHGMWLGGDEAGELAAVLADEVQRCGLAKHVTHPERSSLDMRLCGDVAFLPFRDPGDPYRVHQAAITGSEVVTFPVWPIEDPALRTVEHLDLEAAAAAIIDSSRGDRAARAAAARSRLDVAAVADDLLDAIAKLR